MKHLRPYQPEGIGPLFDLMEGKKLREEGITQVSVHNESWMDRCLRRAEGFAVQRKGLMNDTFTGEDIRFYCKDYIEQPKHPNAWGALINTLVKRNVIRSTGQYQQPKDKSSHARAIQIYRPL